jgi:hypothetical protein
MIGEMVAVLQTFHLASDLQAWLVQLIHDRRLNYVIFDSSTEPGRLRTEADELVVTDQTWRVFMFDPALSPSSDSLEWSDVRPLEWGWLDFAPAGIIERDGRTILTSGQFSADDVPGMAKPSLHLRWLRRNAQPSMHCRGVATDMRNGASREYPNICYSDAALDILRRGGLWKQSLVAPTVFTPVGWVEK